MSHEEEAVLALPVSDRQRMAVLALQGWKFELLPNARTTGRMVVLWRAVAPDQTAYAGTSLFDLLERITTPFNQWGE